MQLPFSTAQFVHVFESYNAGIGFAPIVAYALATVALALAFRGTRRGSRAIALILASFWAFTGVAYHLMSFSAINPAARFFGVAFVIEACLIAFNGMRGRLEFGVRRDARSRIGLALVAWAMIGYPLAGALLGHGYPHGPVFALTPCPLLIFTFGLLLLAKKVPGSMVRIPLMWTIVGTAAAFALGVTEDVTLALSALVFYALLVGPAVARRLASRARVEQAPC
jgi:hypothetical protein